MKQFLTSAKGLIGLGVLLLLLALAISMLFAGYGPAEATLPTKALLPTQGNVEVMGQEFKAVDNFFAHDPAMNRSAFDQMCPPEEFDQPISEDGDTLTANVLVLMVPGEPTNDTCVTQGDTKDFDGVTLRVLQVGAQFITEAGRTTALHEVLVFKPSAWWEPVVAALPLLLTTVSGAFLGTGGTLLAASGRP